MAALTRIRIDVFECLGFMRFVPWSVGQHRSKLERIVAAFQTSANSIQSLPTSRRPFQKVFDVQESCVVSIRFLIETYETKILLVNPEPPKFGLLKKLQWLLYQAGSLNRLRGLPLRARVSCVTALTNLPKIAPP
jgi:hypothetical protein